MIQSWRRLRNVVCVCEEVKKRSAKTRKQIPAKRDLFAEISEGIVALASARQGKRTLRTYAAKSKRHRQLLDCTKKN